MPTHGDDVLFGGPGGDVIDAQDGTDAVSGGGGDDRISGGGGSDVLVGGDGADVLWGFGPADGDPAAGTITAVRVASGLSNPLFAASPPGRPDELFVIEQNTGRILILDLTTGAVLPTPFLDIPASEMSTGGERGLLGLAFHPDYANNGKFYVNLTNAAGDTEIREYTRSATDPNVANPTGRLILTFDQPFENHNGGWLGFGPDGYLYIASGDGGSGGDPDNHAQNINSLLGKILRIDVNSDGFPNDPTRNYAIPPGNPFVGVNGADEVWAYGLRNPWRMSFDSNGDLYVGDVGQNAREEINHVPAGTGAGMNFGWRRFEGDTVFAPNTPAPGAVPPLLAYGRTQGQSVTGGYVYHGPGGAQDLYFFGDFVSGALWTVRVVDGRPVDFLQRNAQLAVDAGTVNLIASFAVDGRGRLYVIGLDGEIHRLTPSASAADGPDALYGGAGDDIILGGAGDDRLFGEDGSDTLYGGIGADALSGGAQRDVLFGQAGDDVLVGEAGDDALTGGDGADRLYGGDGLDVLVGEAGADALLGEAGDDQLHGGAGADAIAGGDGADSLFGGDGDDVIVAGAGADGVVGGAGNDALYGGLDADVLIGEGGVDDLLGEDGADQLYGSAGADRLSGGAGDDALFGEDGDDMLSGDAGHDGLTGGDGADLLQGGDGDDVVLGGAGIDQLYGGAGADQLHGGDGIDYLFGQAGADALFGGAGGDWFFYGAVSDSAAGAADGLGDFDPLEDAIDLSRVDADVNTAGDQAFSFVGAFTGVAGQATLTYEPANDVTRFLADVDGDGVADMEITIAGNVDASRGWVL